MTKNQSYLNHITPPNLKCSLEPQYKGTVNQVRIQTPRKPNSARRSVIKLNLNKIGFRLASVKGGSHNLKKYSTTLTSSGGARDLPGVYFGCIRGVYDLVGIKRTRRKSIYGYSTSTLN